MENINDVPMKIEKESRKGRKKRVMIIGISFLAILLLLFFTAFSGKFNIVGNVIGGIGTTKNITTGTEIKTSLTVPEISLNQEMTRVEISSLGNPNSKLFVDDMVFPRSYKIVLEDFKGRVYFDDFQITKLDGKAEGVYVNDLPVSSKSEKQMEIETEDAYDYDFLSIKDVYIKEINYNSSGTVQVGKGNSLSVDNDKVEIENFFGSLKIQNNKFELDGLLESFKVPGISVY